MKVLIVHGSRRGGTAGIAEQVAAVLRRAGHAVDVLAAPARLDAGRYDAVVVGGALDAGRWHVDARSFVLQNAGALRTRRVWMFSSGPLDDSASREEVPPTAEVRELMALAGAEGHATFGGRVVPDVRDLLASPESRPRAGDWRDPAHIARWSRELADRLDPGETPRASWRPALALPPLLVDVALAATAGLLASSAGAALVARPDGTMLGLSAAALRHTPFGDYLAPGALLLAGVALPNLAAMVLQARLHPAAPLASYAGGAALVVAAVVASLLLPSPSAGQLAALALGVALVARSFRAGRHHGGLPAQSV